MRARSGKQRSGEGWLGDSHCCLERGREGAVHPRGAPENNLPPRPSALAKGLRKARKPKHGLQKSEQQGHFCEIDLRSRRGTSGCDGELPTLGVLPAPRPRQAGSSDRPA